MLIFPRTLWETPFSIGAGVNPRAGFQPSGEIIQNVDFVSACAVNFRGTRTRRRGAEIYIHAGAHADAGEAQGNEKIGGNTTRRKRGRTAPARISCAVAVAGMPALNGAHGNYTRAQINKRSGTERAFVRGVRGARIKKGGELSPLFLFFIYAINKSLVCIL